MAEFWKDPKMEEMIQDIIESDAQSNNPMEIYLRRVELEDSASVGKIGHVDRKIYFGTTRDNSIQCVARFLQDHMLRMCLILCDGIPGNYV